MSKKPGLFSRLRQSISSTLNDAVDSISDPGQEVALMLDDLAAQIQQTEKDLRQAMVDRKVMERKVEELDKQEADWQRRAEQALKLGDENLAREALKRKVEYGEQAKDTKVALREQAALVDQMHQHVKESKTRLKSLNLRRGSLMAQARAAKKGFAPGQVNDAGAGARMDSIESRIAEIEALNEVQAELSGDVKEAEVDAKLAELAGESELDDALAELKAKLQTEQKKSLPEGDSE
jgi:phage shock protein A